MSFIVNFDKAKAIRFSTLEATCRELECQPGELLEYVADEDDEALHHLQNFEL